MKLKKILRVVYRAIYWFSFGYILALRISGENTIIINIALVAGCLNIITNIIQYILKRISYGKFIKNFKKMFYYMSVSHKARYGCLLAGDINGAKEYEELISSSSDTILKIGSSVVENKDISPKEQKEIQEIIDKTKVLITQIQPPV